MPYVLVEHSVANYEKFEPAFHDDEARRRRAMSGSKGGTLYRDIADPNSVVVLFEWDTVERARAFADSHELRESVEWSGGATPPRVTVIEEILRTDA
jgi:heme-degrading monooxygenase HmoA